MYLPRLILRIFSGHLIIKIRLSKRLAKTADWQVAKYEVCVHFIILIVQAHPLLNSMCGAACNYVLIEVKWCLFPCK